MCWLISETLSRWLCPTLDANESSRPGSTGPEKVAALLPCVLGGAEAHRCGLKGTGHRQRY